MPALIALARSVLIGGPGRALLTGATAGSATGIDFLPGIGTLRGLLSGDDKPHRHRRRKMFTNTDIAQFAAAESIAGKAAARSLMMIRAAKA